MATGLYEIGIMGITVDEQNGSGIEQPLPVARGGEESMVVGKCLSVDFHYES